MPSRWHREKPRPHCRNNDAVPQARIDFSFIGEKTMNHQSKLQCRPAGTERTVRAVSCQQADVEATMPPRWHGELGPVARRVEVTMPLRRHREAGSFAGRSRDHNAIPLARRTLDWTNLLGPVGVFKPPRGHGEDPGAFHIDLLSGLPCRPAGVAVHASRLMSKLQCRSTGTDGTSGEVVLGGTTPLRRQEEFQGNWHTPRLQSRPAGAESRSRTCRRNYAPPRA